MYPYIFIDQTNQARVTNLQVYTDILSQHKKVVSNSMIYYLVAERDFNSKCEIIDQNTAKHADSKQTKNDEDSGEVSRALEKTNIEKESVSSPKAKRNSPDEAKSNRREPSKSFQRYLERRRIERAVEQTLQKHNRSSKL